MQSVEQSKVDDERLLIDISSSNAKSLGGKCHWLLVLDDGSDNAWNYFLKQKRDLKLKIYKGIQSKAWIC